MTTFQAEFSEAESEAIAKEFQRVGDNIYLDHAGTTLYSERQVDAAAKELKENLFCNPHTCKVTGDMIDQVRYRILKHFNTDANNYAVVFTANATAALKLVAECFSFGDPHHCGSFYYCQENHTSVLGMRAVVETPNLYVLTKDELLRNMDSWTRFKRPELPEFITYQGHGMYSLVAFSAQCNFSGYKMPLEIVDPIQRRGLVDTGNCVRNSALHPESADLADGFFVCLDTASFVASNFLDLQKYKPDYCCISFYKMFGFPTGVGALLVSQRGQELLKKRFYGGGTVQIAMTRENFHQKRNNFTERFEDGTLPFLSIVSLMQSFKTLEQLVPPAVGKTTMQRISAHVYGLAKYCHAHLAALKHGNGTPLVKFYNHKGYESQQWQGGLITFNLMNADGSYVGFAEVACLAAVHNIQLRTGCFCNPGACQHFLQLSDADVRNQFKAGHICSDYNDLVDGYPTGAVRMSFGYMTTVRDVDKAVAMISECFLTTAQHRAKLIDSTILPAGLRHVPERFNAKLKKICVYPVKSCAALHVIGGWELTACGLQFDRNWMIVDSNGMAITQKHHARLCLIKPQFDFESDDLILSFPKMKCVRIPLYPAADGKHIESNCCRTKVCNDMVDGLDCGDEVAAWLEDCLQVEGLRLIKQHTDRHNASGEAKELSLANQSQFLLINRTSVAWLVNRANENGEPLNHTVDRFRGNLIIETHSPLEENNFEELRIDGVTFKVDGFCTRCQMICIDQHSGRKTAEPLKTIAREFNGKIRFGIYLSLKHPVEPGTMISDGTTIDITLKRPVN